MSPMKLIELLKQFKQYNKKITEVFEKEKAFWKKVKKVLDKLESVRYNIRAVTKAATKNLDN